MKKKFKQPTNIREELPGSNGKYSVKDTWPPVSQLWKHGVASRIETTVTAGKVYVEKYPPDERQTTTIYIVGESFVQEPGTIYLMGSVLGGETISVSDDPIPLDVKVEPPEAN